MSTTVMGTEPRLRSAPWDDPSATPPIEEAIALGIANQLTNILRDVGEDARRGRIYLPMEDLARFDYTEEDLIKGVIDERWKALMSFQIERARKFYALAERGISALSEDARLPVWSALMMYSQILDMIERNGYDNFQKRAFVSGRKKIMSLPIAWLRAKVL